jgi:outer membrane protein assembly factor BamB
MAVAEVNKLIRAHWKELWAKYEVEKKKDPDFAVPPTEDQVPRAAPVRVWQEGSERWHVDAPVTVVDERVLAGSAYLDKEKVGDRSLLCLDAKTGKIIWRTPLALNPWGGASVSGVTIVVTGSSIGYYPNLLKGANGQVAAYDLTDGKEKWRKPLKAGVVSCAAVADGVAIATATDGKVRAFDLTSGEKRWIYEGKAPFFAAPAVAVGVVYAGDLQGVVHAIDIKTGQARWTLDLQAPGMIYGGPVVHGGRVYVATCNLEGPTAGQPTAVICIGE